MVSQAKQIANQLNASKSTGPRTDEGKRRASQNRLRHGFFSAAVVLEGEDPALYAALIGELVEEHKPQTPTQMGCVQRIGSCMWKLWRIEGSAAHTHERRAVIVRHEAAQWQEDAGNALRGARFERYHQLWHAGKPQLGRMRERFQQLADHAPPAATLAASMIESDHNAGGSGEFDRLVRYEQRLQNMIHRALAELRKLRKDRAEVEALPQSPYATERDEPCNDDERNDQFDGITTDHPAIVRNEPTGDPRAAAPPGTLSPNPPVSAPAKEQMRNEPTEIIRQARRASSG